MHTRSSPNGTTASNDLVQGHRRQHRTKGTGTRSPITIVTGKARLTLGATVTKVGRHARVANLNLVHEIHCVVWQVSLKQLYDVLDENRLGTVSFKDLAT